MPTMQEQNSQAFDNFIEFMQEYNIFLTKMMRDEKDRFAALASRQLPRIEHSITVSQANAKQLENYEIKRQMLQTKAGYAGLSFTEILEKLPLEQQGILQPMFTQFGSMVEEIQFSNHKAMAVARDNMMAVSPELVVNTATKKSNPYANAVGTEQHSVLKTKI